MKMTEARNYLLRLAEDKDRQRKKELSFWQGVADALEMLPRTQDVQAMLRYCHQRKTLYEGTLQTGIHPENAFYMAMLEEVKPYEKLAESDMTKILIEAQQARAVKEVQEAPAPKTAPAPATKPGPIAGEVEEDDDLDDDLDDKPEVEPI